MHSQRCFRKLWAYHSCSLNMTPQNLLHFSLQSLIWIFSTYDINGVMDWMFVFLQNSYAEILTSKVMALGGRALEVVRSWAGSPHECDWCPYKKEAYFLYLPISLLFPPHEDTQRRQPFSNHELDSHQMPPGLTSTLNLEIQLPRTVRNKCGLSRPVYGNCYNS